MMRVTFDTSMLVAAAHSRRGASFALLSAIPTERFQICLSVALYLEWQAVLTRVQHLPPGANADDVSAFLRYLASHAHLQEIYFLWRPFLPDPDDDMILELAVASGSACIVTLNPRHFRGCDRFKIDVLSPGDFLKLVRS